MAKKQTFSPVLVGAVLTLVIGIALVFLVSQDWATGHNKLIDYARAVSGDARAQYELGQRLAHANITDPDDKARVWYERAADKGYIPAMVKMGDLYNADPDEAHGDLAVKWYQKASDAGDVGATLKLAAAYDVGRGTLTPDPIRSEMLWEKAARAGNLEGETYYGRSLLRDGKLDDGEAWLLKASAAGDVRADAALGNLYFPEYSPKHDWAKAFTYYQKACEGGISEVMINYAFLWRNGLGGATQDDAEAYKWILLESDVRKQETTGALYWLRGVLPHDTLVEGEKRAVAWRASHPPVKV